MWLKIIYIIKSITLGLIVYRKLLCLIFCVGSMFWSATSRAVNSVADKQTIEILKINKKIAAVDSAIDLKCVKGMLGLVLCGMAMGCAKYLPNSFVGYTGGFLFGSVLGLPGTLSLIAFIETNRLSHLKSKLEVERARLLSLLSEQDSDVSEEQVVA